MNLKTKGDRNANLQPDLNGALFVIAILEKFYRMQQVNRNDKKAGVEGGSVAQILRSLLSCPIIPQKNLAISDKVSL